MKLRSKHQRTLDAIFERPTRSNIHWHDIESLFRALGATVTERSGSAIMVDLNGVTIGFHRPHPGRDARRYQIEATREFLRTAGVWAC